MRAKKKFYGLKGFKGLREQVQKVRENISSKESGSQGVTPQEKTPILLNSLDRKIALRSQGVKEQLRKIDSRIIKRITTN